MSKRSPSRRPEDLTPERVEETRLQPALDVLAGVLAARGEPVNAPFARFMVPPLVEPSLDPASAAEWAIALVHAVFHAGPRSGALTAATKAVGTAALGVKRALAKEASRRAGIARREATLLPVRVKRIPAAKLAA